MDGSDVSRAADESSGRPTSVFEPEGESWDRPGDSDGHESFTTAAKVLPRLVPDQPAEEGAAEVAAQWALWGKDDNESDYHVLRCSKGVFGLGDFDEIITRYAAGAKETLPQYTACWIPAQARSQGSRAGTAAEGNGDRGYLAVGIHERVGPGHSGGRARSAAGREIEYIRLFCVRYAELAEHGVGYTDLVDAVRERQLPPDNPTALIPVPVPEPEQHPLPADLAGLAQNAAVLLLTTRPVCVLGAEAASAEDRLEFIESVMALLPYGLRTTLSASTWASATAQDLKLRLFFSNAKRDDGGWTRYVTWGRPVQLDSSAVGDEAAWLYLSWLRQADVGATAALYDMKAPVRFNPAEIREMVGDLPKDMSVEDTLKELATCLRRRDQAAVSAEVQRIKRYLVRTPDPAERLGYLRLIGELRLLGDHRWLHASRRMSLYRVLLKLVFPSPLGYGNYCEIEDAGGGPPRGVLRSVLLREYRFATYLPWILTISAGHGTEYGPLMDALAGQGVRATDPVTVLQRNVERIRPAHRPAMYDIAVRYLCGYAADARAELERRGYLTDTLQVIFPRDQRAQRLRLEAALAFVYGGSLRRSWIRRIWDRIRRRGNGQIGLSRGQVRELFDNPRLVPTAAFEAAVGHLAPSRKARQYIAKQAHLAKRQAALARLQEHGYGDDARILLRTEPRADQRRPPGTFPDTIGGGFPKSTVWAFTIILTVLIFYILYLYVTR